MAPDLPGHGGSEPAVGGKYIPSDAALVAVEVLSDAGLGDPPPLVLGHGWGAYAAELLAAGGRTGAIVLVDGLGGPWLTEEEVALDQARWLRGVLEDPEATRRPEALPDPILAHGFPSVWEQGFTESRRRAIEVPVLAIETLRSPTPDDERAGRAAAFGGRHRLLPLRTERAQDSVEEIAAAVLGWPEGREPSPV
jgi:pimeloyl-ACP methyl ester carboxylesterase